MMTGKEKLILKIKKREKECTGFIKVLSNPLHPNNSGMNTRMINELLETEEAILGVWAIVLADIEATL